MTYAIPNATQVVGFIDIMRFENTVVGGAMGYAILVLIFLVILFGARRYNPGKWSSPLLISCFVTTMVAGALLTMGVVNGYTFWITGALLLFAYIFSKHS